MVLTLIFFILEEYPKITCLYVKLSCFRIYIVLSGLIFVPKQEISIKFTTFTDY